jgi:transcriptional regulator with XRE-family HTH domain
MDSNYNPYHHTDSEILREVARSLKGWRMAFYGAAMTQDELAEHAGVSISSIKRFEKSGQITLKNFIAIMRSMRLLDNFADLIPDPDSPGPLELLEAQQKRLKLTRKRAPRRQKGQF